MSDPMDEHQPVHPQRAVARTAPRQALAGTTVLVAGPGSHLTFAIAGAARDAGADVALATSRPVGDAAVADLAWFRFAGDSEDDAETLFDELAARFDRIDVAIIVVPVSPLEVVYELSLDDWRSAVTRPLHRTFCLARRAIEEGLAVGAATRLVLLLEPERGAPRNEVVEDSLRALARSSAREYGRRTITCNVVVPVLDTAAASDGADLRDAIIEHALVLASPAASFVNGETLLVEPQ
jgi:NAD(P)-dependent dehydrogenase (short-subunit alcohol dehydrogenase family)